MKRFILIIVPFALTVNLFAHSGRTDGSGGHRDNQNASGLGSYHYHCGGYPPHLHKGGVCPYRQPKSSTSKSIEGKQVVNQDKPKEITEKQDAK